MNFGALILLNQGEDPQGDWQRFQRAEDERQTCVSLYATWF